MKAALFLALAGFVLAAAAADAPPPAADVPRIGARTEALLELQRSGRQAGARQPLRGNQAEAARRRYLNSFGHPIPAQFPESPATTGAAGPK